MTFEQAGIVGGTTVLDLILLYYCRNCTVIVLVSPIFGEMTSMHSLNQSLNKYQYLQLTPTSSGYYESPVSSDSSSAY